VDEAAYLRHATQHFATIRRQGERALAQVLDERFFRSLDPESNSLATLVKHLSGNLRSRWTDFLTTDGEKPDRRRDGEFVVEAGDSRDALMARWESGWAALARALDSLRPEDLVRTVTIRGEPLSAFDAIERQKEHYAYHVGQIVFLAKHLAGSSWSTLSIPRGQSDAFHAARRAARGRP
jgi:hypothetical protein